MRARLDLGKLGEAVQHLSGAATVEQLKENAAALAITPLSDETMRLLADTMAIECEDYWAERRGLAWN